MDRQVGKGGGPVTILCCDLERMMIEFHIYIEEDV